jgi:multisubunit Na+/H+ antiporter MnhE subunit
VGVFRGIPFEAGPDDDPNAVARRAAYTAQISLTPNTYVIGIDRELNNMLVHELVAGPREETRDRVLGKL